MSTLELRVYEIFKNKLGEKEAEVVIEYFESKTEEKYQQKKDVFLTKEDKMDILSKIETTNTRIEMAKTDMIKWFFAFSITIVLMIAGLYFKK
ncbi:MAG: hypothetical protein H7257_12980 [Taibaiella sp.]|nr:hypothetical protein [Taibaiella sp.]